MDPFIAWWLACLIVWMPSQADEMKEKGKDDGLDARLRAVAEM